MGKGMPWRRRENIVMLCKAVIKYAEGPGEIDSQVNAVCDRLGDLANLMKDAHERALEEIALAQARYEQRRELLSDIPKHILKQVVIEYFKVHPDEIPAEEDWGSLDEVFNQ